MKRFKFSLDALLKLRINDRDRRRLEFAAAQRVESELQERREQIVAERTQALAELREIAGAGEVDIDRAAARRYHAGKLLLDIAYVDRDRLQAAQYSTQCRQALLVADQAVRALERLEERQRSEFMAEQQRRADHQLEETWRAAHAGRDAE